MQQIVQYNVEIACDPCPRGHASDIQRRLQQDFPVTECRYTETGLAMQLLSLQPLADGMLRDFSDLAAETLSDFGISMTTGVVRMLTREAPSHHGVVHRVRAMTAAVTGIDWRPVREVPVLYFYKGLRFDLDLSERLQRLNQREGVGAY